MELVIRFTLYNTKFPLSFSRILVAVRSRRRPSSSRSARVDFRFDKALHLAGLLQRLTMTIHSTCTYTELVRLAGAQALSHVVTVIQRMSGSSCNSQAKPAPRWITSSSSAELLAGNALAPDSPGSSPPSSKFRPHPSSCPLHFLTLPSPLLIPSGNICRASGNHRTRPLLENSVFSCLVHIRNSLHQ